MNLDAELEAILFYKNEPVNVKKLASILGKSEEDVQEASLRLQERLSGGGVVLISNGTELSLGTAPDAAPLIEGIIKEDLSNELGKASLDTLTIILYYGPVSKAQIDNIRGVNSGFILRNLLMRGLIEKIQNDKDQRSYIYRPTVELIAHLGIRDINELPGYLELRKALADGIAEMSNGE